MIKRKTTESQTAVVETQQQGTHKEPEQTNAESQTPQPPRQYDISQGDAPMDVEPPHVEDRRAQLLEQETRHHYAKGNKSEWLLNGVCD